MKKKRGRPRKQPENPQQEESGYVFELDFPFQLLQLCSEIEEDEHKAFKATIGVEKREDVSLSVHRDNSRLKILMQGTNVFPVDIIENKWRCTISSVCQQHDGKGDEAENVNAPETPGGRTKRRKTCPQSPASGDGKELDKDAVETPEVVHTEKKEPPEVEATAPSVPPSIDESPVDVPTPVTSSRKSARISTVSKSKSKSGSPPSSACKIVLQSPVKVKQSEGVESTEVQPAKEGTDLLLPQYPQVELMPEISEDLRELIQEVVTDLEEGQSTSATPKEVIPDADLEQLVIAEDIIKDEASQLSLSSRSRRIRKPKHFGSDVVLTKSTKKKKPEAQVEDINLSVVEEDKAETDQKKSKTPVVKVKQETESEFSCDRCSKQLATFLELVDHKSKDHGIKRRGRKPKALKLLEEEERMKNDPDYTKEEKPPPKKRVPMACPGMKCDTSLIDKKSLVNHVKETHRDDPDYSDTVQKADALIHKVYYEDKVREETVHMTCEVCGVVRIGFSIYHHLEFCHPNMDNYQQILTDLNVKYEEERKKARKIIKKRYEDKVKNKGLVFMCQYCGKQFEFRPTRANHEKFRCKHNPNRQQLSECYVCGFATPSTEKFEDHMKKHDGFTFLECKICGKKYKTRAGLIVHNRKVHNIIKRRPIIMYPCEICGRSFFDKDHLRIHVAIHSDARLYQCELCGSQYKTAAQVQKHQKMVHFNRYAFHCEKCGHGVEKRAYLANHKCGRVRRVQAQERSFADPTRIKGKKDRAPIQKIAKKQPQVEYFTIVQPRKGSKAPTYITSVVKQDPEEEQQPMHVMLEFQSDGQPQTTEGSALQLGEYMTSEGFQEGTTEIQTFPEAAHASEPAQQFVAAPHMVTADGQTILKVIEPGDGVYGHLMPVDTVMEAKQLRQEMYETTGEVQGIELIKQEGDMDDDISGAVEESQDNGIQMEEVEHTIQMQEIQTEQGYVHGGIEVDMKISEMDGQEIEMEEVQSDDSDLASASLSMGVSEHNTELSAGAGNDAVATMSGEVASSSEFTEIIEVPTNVAVAGFSAEEHMVWEDGSVDHSEKAIPVSQITLEELQKLGFSLTSVSQQDTTYVYAPTSAETTVISDTIEATEEVVVASDSDYFVIKGQESEET